MHSARSVGVPRSTGGATRSRLITPSRCGRGTGEEVPAHRSCNSPGFEGRRARALASGAMVLESRTTDGRGTNTADAGEVPAVVSDEVEVPGPSPSRRSTPQGNRGMVGGVLAVPDREARRPRSDLRALARLALLYDERDRALAAYKRKRSSTGSTGQLVVNPFARGSRRSTVESRNLRTGSASPPKADSTSGSSTRGSRRALRARTTDRGRVRRRSRAGRSPSPGRRRRRRKVDEETA